MMRLVPDLHDIEPKSPPPFYWLVPCTDGVHEILISKVTALYSAGRRPQAFEAMCRRIVRPVDGPEPEPGDRCPDCVRTRVVMDPEPAWWGDPRPFGLVLAGILGRESGAATGEGKGDTPR